MKDENEEEDEDEDENKEDKEESDEWQSNDKWKKKSKKNHTQKKFIRQWRKSKLGIFPIFIFFLENSKMTKVSKRHQRQHDDEDLVLTRAYPADSLVRLMEEHNTIGRIMARQHKPSKQRRRPCWIQCSEQLLAVRLRFRTVALCAKNSTLRSR